MAFLQRAHYSVPDCSERQRDGIKRATDIVLIESGAIFYWPRTGEQFHINDAACAMARVQATLTS